MRETVSRHFWKVVIILLVILAAILFAPRMRVLSPTPQPAEVPAERG